ncbi:hypothetical protein M3Y99_00305300 [Aphelenchoides fujianensis]|nr:hypothetical protein M3Y99_00305300 [Aphelenchoides fujianensis]
MGGGTPERSFSYTPKILNGGLAGIVGVTCVFPLDLVKTRLQNQRPNADGTLKYKGIIDCARKTWKAGGTHFPQRLAGMYSGSGVNLLLITPEKAIKLVANDFFRYKLSVPGEKHLSAVPRDGRRRARRFLPDHRDHSDGTPEDPTATFVSFRSPPFHSDGLQKPAGKKESAMQLARQLVREKGIAGLYRGISPTMARDVTFSMIYFPLFAKLDALGPRKSDGSGDAAFYASFMAGIIAGAVGSFSVTPLDVIKTRIQLINNEPGVKPYKGIADAFVSSNSKERRPSSKELGARMIVMAPLFGIAQTVYYIGVAERLLGIQKAGHV